MTRKKDGCKRRRMKGRSTKDMREGQNGRRTVAKILLLSHATQASLALGQHAIVLSSAVPIVCRSA